MPKDSENKPVLKNARPIDEGVPEKKPSGGRKGSSSNPLLKARDVGAGLADSAMNAAKNGAQQMLGGIAGMPGAAKAMAGKAVGKVARSLGISQTAAGIGIAVVGLVGGAGTVVSVTNYNNTQRIYRQEGFVDGCAEAMYNESKVQGETTAMEGDEMMYAEMMYGILANLGCTPDQCAGAVSSMAAESGLDPTSVEGIYNERYQIGPKKALYVEGNKFTPAIEDHFNYLKQAYAKSGISISVRGYTAENGQMTCGIGLLQYTGVGATGLMAMADTAGKNWYDFDVQMAYMMSDQSGFGARVRKFKEVSQGMGAVECADAWTKYVEMGGGSVKQSMLDSHRQKAAEVASTLGARHEALQSEYASVATDVQELAGANFGAATEARTNEVMLQCGSEDGSGLDGVYDNTGMARLMTLYCYQDYHSSEATATGGNPQKRGGTKLYQELRDSLTGSALAGDSYWNSCDRGVATAVICSGADDNFNIGGCSNMLAYLLGSDKWAKVGALNDVYDQLEPGDICIYSRPGHGHVIMYTGSELNSAEGGAGEISSASYGERYPGMGSMRQHYVGSDNYTVFRYTGSFDGRFAVDLSTVKSPADHH